MIQTINPYANTARTAEIMSRYRPIAPKPEAPITNSGESDQSSGVPKNISKSPYLRNVWANLQARPTRTRKRSRTAAFATPSLKQVRPCLQGLSPPYLQLKTSSAVHDFGYTRNGLPQISLLPLKCGGELDNAVSTLAESVAVLPLLRREFPGKSAIELNMVAETYHQKTVRELDFMAQLKEPVKQTIIAPQAVRPIGSKITVKGVSENLGQNGPNMVKGAEEVEKEAEAENVPAIVSDSRNRVRLTNSAYKKMVGQPECAWLDCVATGECGGAWRRIGGEVVLQFGDSPVEMSMDGFNCSVNIEWEKNGKKRCVDGSCKGVKLECGATDYQFLWRFHISES